MRSVFILCRYFTTKSHLSYIFYQERAILYLTLFVYFSSCAIYRKFCNLHAYSQDFASEKFYLYNNKCFILSKDDISHNKSATQLHTYTGVGYDATNAVDGNIATCMRTKEIGPNSPDKTVWWKVDLGGIFNIYRINILFKNYDGFGVY